MSEKIFITNNERMTIKVVSGVDHVELKKIEYQYSYDEGKTWYNLKVSPEGRAMLPNIMIRAKYLE